MQIAPINVARRVDGTQIGVINVGGAGDGVPIGLIDIVPGGRTDVEASVDPRSLGTVLLRHGSRNWHNVYGLGGQRADDASAATTATTPHEDLWMAGLGLGPTWRAGGTTWDLDAMAWHVWSRSHYDHGLSSLNRSASPSRSISVRSRWSPAARSTSTRRARDSPYLLLRQRRCRRRR